MSTFIWVAAGAALGFVGFMFLKLNEKRGMLVAMIIGAAGGFVGGRLVSPMFNPTEPGVFSTASLVVAILVAATFVGIANLVRNRWDI